MNPQQPEAPLSSRERDALRRWPFAHSIYQLIQSAPKEWSLRIGIYGRWGEGKTTVLNYVEQMARKDGFPVAKFNPWAAQNREELWVSLVLAIESAFKRGNLTKTKLKGKAAQVIKSDGVRKILEKGFNLAGPGLGEVAEAIGGLLGPLMQDQLRVSRNDAEQVIRQNLGDQKLIILVDDLDRANPDLVPHLLLGLREILDLQQCVFIMGLDPVIVSNALSDVHGGWGRTPEFLEKIIDFPFWLSPVNHDDIRCLLDQELKDSPINIDGHALAEVIHLLPTNPRKLKRFLRGLWRFKAQIERHEESETEWMLLLLIELLRTVSFKTAERLLAHKDLWEELWTSRFKGKLTESNGDKAIEEKWVSIMKRVLNQEHDKEGSLLETEQAEFLRVMNAMRDIISIAKWQNLHYWASLEDDPPIFTWKEFKRLFEGWKANPTKAFLEELIKSHADRIETRKEIVTRDLFSTAIAYREQLLDQAAGSGSENELVLAVKEADVCLSMLRMLISEVRGFSGNSPFLLTSDFTRMFNHFSKWAHWLNHASYLQARSAEAAVLKRAAQDASKNAAEILDELQPWSPLRESMEKEAGGLMDRLVEELIPGVICNLRNRFTRKDGIDSLWGHERHPTEKWVLFRRDSGFYSGDGLEFLRAVVDQAKTDTVIHTNLVQFILMLGHALKNGVIVLGPSEIHPLASDKDIIPLVWQGAVSNRLQPRMIGSLKGPRAQLAGLLGKEELLPVPVWWNEETTDTTP